VSSGQIHHAAAGGFGATAHVYERARPDYPMSAINHLVERLDIRPGATVLDLGAGTGKLTRQLVPTGATIVAIEPVEAMRAQLQASVPGVEVIDCTAEQISWPDADADAVVAGQAFHWFDAPRALIEIHRVLRSGGGLGLMWNTRDETEPWAARITEIIRPYEGDAPRERHGDWRRAFDEAALFTALDEAVFTHGQRLDVEGLVDRVASMSFIAIQPDDVRATVLEQVRELVAELPEPFDFPYRTHVYTCNKR
jgi:SAM-dependent methyltransferase